MKAAVLGLVDHAHSTSTELLDDAIVGNGLRKDQVLVAGRGLIWNFLLPPDERLSSYVQSGSFDEIFCLGLITQQRLHLLKKIGITSASFLQERRTPACG